MPGKDKIRRKVQFTHGTCEYPAGYKKMYFEMYTSVFSKVVVLLLDSRREYALQVSSSRLS